MDRMDDVLAQHQRAVRILDTTQTLRDASPGLITSSRTRLLASRHAMVPWPRRRIAGGSAQPPYDGDPQVRVRALIESGVLPRENSKRVWAGKGSGAICAVCQTPITADMVEYELDDVDVRLHSHCHAAWLRPVDSDGPHRRLYNKLVKVEGHEQSREWNGDKASAAVVPALASREHADITEYGSPGASPHGAYACPWARRAGAASPLPLLFL
jgi:hypothetical protein